MVAKKRGNARKNPEIVRFRGFEAMISFLASRYGCGTRIRTLVMTESESVALPLGDAALLTNAPHYSRFPRACQELLKKITEFSVNYRNCHHLQEWVVAEMPGQCAGAWAEKPTPLLGVPDWRGGAPAEPRRQLFQAAGWYPLYGDISICAIDGTMDIDPVNPFYRIPLCHSALEFD